MPDIWMNEPIRCTITFDKKDTEGVNLKYVSYLGNEETGTIDETGKYIPVPDSNYITSFSLSENEAETTGNPLGIMTSNTCNVSIYDAYNRLMPANTESPFFGYMRNGARIDFEIAYDGETYEPYGTFYVTDWSTGWSNGDNDVAVISGSDRLEYLYNVDVPKLPAYSGITIQTLLVNLFIGIEKMTDDNPTAATLVGSGVPSPSLGVAGDYYINEVGIEVYKKIVDTWELLYFIDPTLDLDLNFGITVGSRVGEVLNSIAQVLVARVILDRANVLKIVPALDVYGNTFTIDNENYENGKSLHNTSVIYNKAKVKYNHVGDSAVGEIITNYGFTLKTGTNVFSGLKFNGKSLTVEDVYFDTPEIVSGHEVTLDNLKYQAYQDGIDVTVDNNTGVSVKCDLIVEGRLINAIDASEEADIAGSDTKVANIFTLETQMLQDSTKAKSLANKISSYIQSMSNLISLNTLLTPKATTGDKIIVDNDIEEFNGVYKIIASDTQHGVGFTKVITLMAIAISRHAWIDEEMWDDTQIWED